MSINKSDVIRDAARGKWLTILPSLAPELQEACDKVGRHVPCPVTGQEKGKDGFRLFKDADQTGGGISNLKGAFADGFKLLMWVNGWNFSETMNEIAIHLGIDNWKASAHVAPIKKVYRKVCDKKALERQRFYLRRVWKESLPINDVKSKLARNYFYSRSIFLKDDEYNCLGKKMRFHPNLEYWYEEKLIGRYPAIISLVSYDDGKPASIHRIYLNEKGLKLKLIVDGEELPSKKLMAVCEDKRLSGGSIQYDHPYSTDLDLSEGVENGLAIQSVIHKPVWPCVSATLLAKFNPPKGVNRLRVWGDLDKSNAGLEAAIELRERMERIGVKVEILLPNADIPDDAKGVDWNDILATKGKGYFPVIESH